MATNPERPSQTPSATPGANADLQVRIEEVLSTRDVTAERLLQLREMLRNSRPGQVPRRAELLTRVQDRLRALDAALNTGSLNADQQRVRAELSALQDRLNQLQDPTFFDQTGQFIGDRWRNARDFGTQTVSGVPSIFSNLTERVGEDWRTSGFNGVMSVAMPILTVLGFVALARAAIKKPKSKLGKAMVFLFGAGVLVAAVNYSGRRAQAEMIDRQARQPAEGRIQEIINTINAGQNVDISDPRLIDIDLFQLRNAPIVVGGHSVRLERVNAGGTPKVRISVGGSTFELNAVGSTAVQSVTRKRGMLDVTVLLGIPTGHAFVTDAEFARIAGQLTGQTSNQTVEVEYFIDAANPSQTRRQNVNLTYVPPVPAGPGPARP